MHQATSQRSIETKPLSNQAFANTEAASAEIAQYIANLAGELAEMARHNQLPILAYLLDMAHVEAVAGQNEQAARAA